MSDVADGTPNTALEAAARGCVVISTPVGDMPDLNEHAVNGYLSDRSAEALWHWILEATQRERYATMSHRIQQSVSRWYWKSVATKFFDLFCDVAMGSPVSGQSVEPV